ncbi:A/G-specific adenine glycosylase [Christiangramia salexigens]|uniref:Adenine DNA glycosylase n=1 Tax=Christiangramia salexigens TaxID=1913577 RepID=A0A1L3J627_9FLAO|nr:A/G-specific adenine glycosylase [Christiangramia salexigens]APG60572.1 A/G-specific adenine glycosylase [Christiangramia salexigens]
MEISNRLTYWYLRNKRDLPWRKSQDPYQIWLSEIILQQTQIKQGLPYFNKFIEAYPSVFDLANAPLEEVLKLWQGLGYYSRARNLHETAKFVANESDGVFPEDYKGLVKLKGVGDYTASAIASFCYGEPVAVVDGNVYRVLSRIFGVETPINSTPGIKEFKNLAREILNKEDPATHNQAIMEFGAMHCKPKTPECDSCVFNDKCVALKENKIKELPVKIKKAKVKKRYFNYLILNSEDRIILERRSGKGIWNGLFQFPLVETEEPIKEEHLMKTEKFQKIIDGQKYTVELFNDKPVVHKLSHQHLYTKFWILDCKELPHEGVGLDEVLNYPVPVLIENFLNEYLPDDYK